MRMPLSCVGSHRVMALLFCVLLAIASACKKENALGTSNVPAENSLATFQVADGFQIEMIASEPLVADPVAMEIDPGGNLYVVEMPGNPFDKSGTGKVKLLSDTDGDGKMDKSSVFADSLIMPSGITSWKNGVLVTDPPRILYLEDSDSDGVADIRIVVLTGFDSTDVESNVNCPVYALDNWVYVGNGPGDGKGDIYYSGNPEGPHIPDNASGHMVRFRPDVKELEMTSSQTQYGHSFDNWGHHFLVNNSNHVYQEVIAARYLKRNPDLLVSDATESLSDHGEAAEVYPITKDPEHQLLTDVGVFTSACSVIPYAGGLFPALFDSVTFVAEPVGNLVHADVLKNHGATFTASRLYRDKEFLASTDAWSRPVNLYIGPDGALYVVDYYREIIEGPEWMAEEVVKSGNLYNGSDKGRIYRVTPEGTKHANWSNNLGLSEATDQILVQKLGDPNIWWRRNAQRLLVERNNPQTVPLLVAVLNNPASPLARLHALWTLQGMNHLTDDLIIKALHDRSAGVRENAVKLAEMHLDDNQELAEALMTLQDDNNAKVRYQLLCTLGFVETSKAAKVRQALLFTDVKDPWVQVAALSASYSQKNDLLNALLQRFAPADSSLVQRLSSMIAAKEGPEKIYDLVQRATARVKGGNKGWQVPVLEGVAEGFKNRRTPWVSPESIQGLAVTTFLENPDANIRKASLHIIQKTGLPRGSKAKIVLARAEQMAVDQTLPIEDRAAGIQLLALTDPAPYASLLKGVIVPSEPLPIQRAALRTLSAIRDVTVSKYVIQQWPVMTPEIRDAALNTFLVYPFDVPRLRLLLDAIADGKIQETSLGWSRTVTLMRDIPDSLKARARYLLTKEDEQRKVYVKQYQAALTLTGDRNNGKEVYLRNCSICHQIGGADGKAFGPDLSTVRNWLPENLILNILDPAGSITNGYDLWAVELNTREIKQGIIASETPSAITLRYPGGAEEIIARNDVRSLKALNTSPMPPGFEKQIDQQQMADLVAFLRNAK